MKSAIKRRIVYFMFKKRRPSAKKQNHFLLSNRLKQDNLEEISHANLKAFLDYLYSNALDNIRDFPSLKNVLLTQASHCGLNGHIYIDLEIENYTPEQKGFLVIRFFGFKLDQPGEELDSSLTESRIWFGNNNQLLGIKFYFESIFFDDSVSPLGGIFNIGIYPHQDHHSSLILNGCCFSSVGLSTESFHSVEILNCSSISPLVIGDKTQQCVISNSSIGKMTVTGEKLIYLRVTNSDIASIEESFFVEKIEKLKFLQFDYRSIIYKNAYATYKNLRMFAETRKDKIQAFSLYKKELNSFSGEGVVDTDSKFLLFFNKFTNANGTSVLLPIVWLFVANFVFVNLIFINEDHLSFEFLFNFMNVLPVTPITDKDFDFFSQAIDSLRRLVSGIFLFLIVSSALRFRYKA